MSDEVDPPDITDIPEEIRCCYNKETKALIQPKEPIVRRGSLAEEEIIRRTAS
jgi:hypothetical protein